MVNQQERIPVCEHIDSSAAACNAPATQLVDVVIDETPILGFRCGEHAAVPDAVDRMLAQPKEQVAQVG